MIYIAILFSIAAFIYNEMTIRKCKRSMERTNAMLKEIIARYEK